MSVREPLEQAAMSMSTAAAEHIRVKNDRSAQFKEALKYCSKNRCTAWITLKKNPNRWPDVKVKALKQRLDGEVSNLTLQPDKQVLADIEWSNLAFAMRAGADAGFPFTSQDRNSAVVSILEWRQSTNRAGGRPGISTSTGWYSEMKTV